MSGDSTSPNSQTRNSCKGFFDSGAHERTPPQESGGICKGFFAVKRPVAPRKSFESPVKLSLRSPPKDFPQAGKHVEEDEKELREVRCPFPFASTALPALPLPGPSIRAAPSAHS